MSRLRKNQKVLAGSVTVSPADPCVIVLRTEYNALLAVAKWARIKHHDLRVADKDCPLCRALARLDRASGGGK